MKIFKSSILKMANVLFACLIIAGVSIDYTFAKGDNIYEEIQRWEKVLAKINRYYVEEVDPDEMVDAAINGMMGILDPHTAFFKKDDYNELMVHTKAEFGGLGITISIRDKVLTVVSPLPGTPASMMGIMAGDRIVKINGKSTKGITVEKAVKKLRGKPGTEVTITIEREGDKEPVDYTITRAVIHIRSVPYYGFIRDSVGYVRLISFSRESGREVEEALKKLKAKKLCGVILDLRNNPGGLLPAAIEVSEKFLGKDRLVVYTRGRMRGQNEEYKTRRAPVINRNKPIVVLVNEGSASASEIVAGAIQDWDRGVIAGRETYGKGSVQTVLPLGMGKNYYLKITTAHYYTPSGRCINKPSNEARFDKKDSEISDSISAAGDTTSSDSAKSKKIYYTKGGRIVYGGGGITPDEKLNLRKWERLEEVLERKSFFFKYAIKKLAKLRAKGVKINRNFKVSDKMFNDFRKFVEKENMKYETNSQKALADLRKAFQQEYGDSSEYKASKAVRAKANSIFKEIELKLTEQKKLDFIRSKRYIKRSIKRELLAGALGEKARYRFVLSYDPQIEEAVKLIKDKGRYKKFLIPAKQ